MTACTKSAVVTELEKILDPCSISVGLSLNIVEMGLIEGIDVGGGTVRVRLRLTSAGCLTGIVFDNAIRERVGSLPGVETVDVLHGDPFRWTEEDMSADAQRQLREVRARRIARTPASAIVESS